jgi:hypothetical protein
MRQAPQSIRIATGRRSHALERLTCAACHAEVERRFTVPALNLSGRERVWCLSCAPHVSSSSVSSSSVSSSSVPRPGPAHLR